jgi:putative hemolysin
MEEPMDQTQPMVEAGTLQVRLARDAADLAAVQHLRWRVFAEEMGARLGGDEPLDADPFDPLCDHLLVIDRAAGDGGAVVGTYRLLRESVARAAGGFYSAGEFDLAPLLYGAGRPHGELLELGRSCVLPPYRTSGTIALLWRGIGDYLARHHIGLLFGCASLPGADPTAHAAALSYLAHHHLAEPHCRPAVRCGMGVPLAQLAPGSYDPRAAARQLPPLVKGYIRAGARFGEGAFVDRAFNTTDVCVVLPVERIESRYAERFATLRTPQPA